MSGRAEVSTPLQGNESAASGGMKIALIGPNDAHRKIVAKALAGSEARSVREFVDYPTNLADLPRLLEQNFDVIMIDVDSDQSYALKLVETVAGLTNAMVMVYSKRNDPDLLMTCMRAGARDFLPLPEAEAEPEPAPAPAAGSGPQLVPLDSRPIPSGAPRSFEPPARSAEPVSFEPPVAGPEPKANDFSSLASLADMRQAAQAHSLQQDIDAWDEAHLRAPDPTIARNPAPIPSVVPPQPSIVRAPEPIPQSIVPPPPPAEEAESKSQPASASEPSKSLTSFDEWDSAFLRKPQSSSLKNPVVSPRAAIAAAPAPPPQPIVKGPEASARSVTPADLFAKAESEQGSIPADTSIFAATRPKIDRASIPVFQYDVPEEEKKPDNKWMIWVGIAAGLGVLACASAVAFLHPFRHSAPIAQQAQVVTQQPQTPQAPPAWQPVDAVNQPSPSPAKPSAATPVDSSVETPDAPSSARTVSSGMMNAQLAAPSRISKDVKAAAASEEAPTGFAPVAMDSGGGAPGTVFGSQSKVQVVPGGVHSISSGVASGMLVRKVEPIYPKFAKDSRVSGTVVLKATITKTGGIEGLQVVSGPKILSEAAMNAVKYWRYRPYLLNNQPVDVQTTINLVFNLSN